jgi:hypothetical protein
MRWQLLGDWPVGQWLVPAGTVLEGTAPTWNGIPLPMPMPLNAISLDDEAALMMLKWYGDQWHRLHFGPGVDADPISLQRRQAAKARGKA